VTRYTTGGDRRTSYVDVGRTAPAVRACDYNGPA
jgi:hypothetical protein